MYGLVPFRRRAGRLARNAFNDVSDVFDNFFNDSSFVNNMMRSDIKEKENEYAIDIELPGIKKEDIDISLDNGYLTVAVDTTEEEKNQEETYIMQERRYGGYQRSFRVSNEIKKEDIKASYNDGILTLAIPKIEDRIQQEDTKITIH